MPDGSRCRRRRSYRGDHPSGPAERRRRAGRRRAHRAREGVRLTAPALLKLLHVALALFAVGTNLSFPIWVRLAERDGAHLAFTLRSIRWIDRYLTIPAYGLVAITGVALAVVEGIAFETPWLGAAIALFVLVVVAGILLYAPVSRRRLAAAERGGPGDPGYREERRRADTIDLFVVPAVLLILGLMVLKPAP